MSAKVVLVPLYCLTTLILFTWNNIAQSKAVGQTNGRKAVDYLRKYGYLSKPKDGQAQAAHDISQSLKAFQRFAGLNVTGKFDEQTVERMKAPRCGDEDPIDNTKRQRRYVLEGSKWAYKDLTYRIVNDPYNGPTDRSIMTPELISKTIKAALQKWSFAADLTFTELKEGEADIMIEFLAGDHGDRYRFDGRGQALAHAFYPNGNTKIAGDAHFDLDEKFSLTEEESTNFIWVTTHEFGHSLGLKHTSEVGAIMYPWYTTGEMGNVELSKDDKRGIRALYGKPVGRNREAPIVLPVPPRKECKYSFSTLIHDKHKKSVYAFKDHDFYVVRHNTGEKPKGPKSVSSRWKGLDIRVRAAYTRNDGYTIFFTRHRYYKYFGTRYVEGPKPIEHYGLTAELRDMDAAVSFPGNRQTYFFKGNQYWKYDQKNKALVPGYPKPIRLFWRGLPDNIDAALQSPKGNTYFFKGQHYYKFDHFAFSVLPGYPKPIASHWLGCTIKESGHEVILTDGNSAALTRLSFLTAIVVALISWFGSWIVVR